MVPKRERLLRKLQYKLHKGPSMHGIPLLDKIRNTETGRRTKVQAVGDRIIDLKWSWAEHLVRPGDSLWSGFDGQG